MSNTEWPKGKRFGELTPAQRQAAVKVACANIQRWMEQPAVQEVFGRLLSEKN